MSSYNKIEKIKYAKSTSEVVDLKEYIVFDNENAEEKYIVFKFLNNVNQRLIGMEFEVSQYDIEGALVQKSVVIYDSFLAGANEEFVPKAKLKVNYACKTISIKLLRAAYDRFLWNDGEYEDNSYKFEHYHRDELAKTPAPSGEKPVNKSNSAKPQNGGKKLGKAFDVKNQTKKNIARFPAVFLAFVFIIVCAFVGVSLYFFQDRSDKFTINNFKLRMLGDGDVSIYGYVGDAEELVIPQEIGGYTVVKIDSGAFKGCKKLRTVTIETSLRIEKHAFVDCKKLELIYSTEHITVLCALEDMCKGCAPTIKITYLTEIPEVPDKSDAE